MRDHDNDDRVPMTQEGHAELLKSLNELEERLAQLLRYKGEEAIQAGDHWHDNPTLYLTEMQERALRREIAGLRHRLSKAVIVEPVQNNEGVVDIGSSVILRFQDGTVERFRLLGFENGDPSRGTISSLSPLGKAILGAKEGEVREYCIGPDIERVVVLEISTNPPADSESAP